MNKDKIKDNKLEDKLKEEKRIKTDVKTKDIFVKKDKNDNLLNENYDIKDIKTLIIESKKSQQVKKELSIINDNNFVKEFDYKKKNKLDILARITIKKYKLAKEIKELQKSLDFTSSEGFSGMQSFTLSKIKEFYKKTDNKVDRLLDSTSMMVHRKSEKQKIDNDINNINKREDTNDIYSILNIRRNISYMSDYKPSKEELIKKKLSNSLLKQGIDSFRNITQSSRILVIEEDINANIYLKQSHFLKMISFLSFLFFFIPFAKGITHLNLIKNDYFNNSFVKNAINKTLGDDFSFLEELFTKDPRFMMLFLFFLYFINSKAFDILFRDFYKILESLKEIVRIKKIIDPEFILNLNTSLKSLFYHFQLNKTISLQNLAVFNNDPDFQSQPFYDSLYNTLKNFSINSFNRSLINFEKLFPKFKSIIKYKDIKYSENQINKIFLFNVLEKIILLLNQRILLNRIKPFINNFITEIISIIVKKFLTKNQSYLKLSIDYISILLREILYFIKLSYDLYAKYQDKHHLFSILTIVYLNILFNYEKDIFNNELKTLFEKIIFELKDIFRINNNWVGYSDVESFNFFINSPLITIRKYKNDMLNDEELSIYKGIFNIVKNFIPLDEKESIKKRSLISYWEKDKQFSIKKRIKGFRFLESIVIKFKNIFHSNIDIHSDNWHKDILKICDDIFFDNNLSIKLPDYKTFIDKTINIFSKNKNNIIEYLKNFGISILEKFNSFFADRKYSIYNLIDKNNIKKISFIDIKKLSNNFEINEQLINYITSNHNVFLNLKETIKLNNIFLSDIFFNKKEELKKIMNKNNILKNNKKDIEEILYLIKKIKIPFYMIISSEGYIKKNIFFNDNDIIMNIPMHIALNFLLYYSIEPLSLDNDINIIEKIFKNIINNSYLNEILLNNNNANFNLFEIFAKNQLSLYNFNLLNKNIINSKNIIKKNKKIKIEEKIEKIENKENIDYQNKTSDIDSMISTFSQEKNKKFFNSKKNNKKLKKITKIEEKIKPLQTVNFNNEEYFIKISDNKNFIIKKTITPNLLHQGYVFYETFSRSYYIDLLVKCLKNFLLYKESLIRKIYFYNKNILFTNKKDDIKIKNSTLILRDTQDYINKLDLFNSLLGYSFNNNTFLNLKTNDFIILQNIINKHFNKETITTDDIDEIKKIYNKIPKKINKKKTDNYLIFTKNFSFLGNNNRIKELLKIIISSQKDTFDYAEDNTETFFNYSINIIRNFYFLHKIQKVDLLNILNNFINTSFKNNINEKKISQEKITMYLLNSIIKKNNDYIKEYKNNTSLDDVMVLTSRKAFLESINYEELKQKIEILKDTENNQNNLASDLLSILFDYRNEGDNIKLQNRITSERLIAILFLMINKSNKNLNKDFNSKVINIYNTLSLKKSNNLYDIINIENYLNIINKKESYNSFISTIIKDNINEDSNYNFIKKSFILKYFYNLDYNESINNSFNYILLDYFFYWIKKFNLIKAYKNFLKIKDINFDKNKEITIDNNILNSFFYIFFDFIGMGNMFNYFTPELINTFPNIVNDERNMKNIDYIYQKNNIKSDNDMTYNNELFFKKLLFSEKSYNIFDKNINKLLKRTKIPLQKTKKEQFEEAYNLKNNDRFTNTTLMEVIFSLNKIDTLYKLDPKEIIKYLFLLKDIFNSASLNDVDDLEEIFFFFSNFNLFFDNNNEFQSFLKLIDNQNNNIKQYNNLYNYIKDYNSLLLELNDFSNNNINKNNIKYIDYRLILLCKMYIEEFIKFIFDEQKNISNLEISSVDLYNKDFNLFFIDVVKDNIINNSYLKTLITIIHIYNHLFQYKKAISEKEIEEIKKKALDIIKIDSQLLNNTFSDIFNFASSKTFNKSINLSGFAFSNLFINPLTHYSRLDSEDLNIIELCGLYKYFHLFLHDKILDKWHSKLQNN